MTASSDPRRTFEMLIDPDKNYVVHIINLVSPAIKGTVDRKMMEKMKMLILGTISILKGKGPKMISEAFSLCPTTTEGFVSLAKGDIDGAFELAQQLGTFSTTKVASLQRLIKTSTSFSNSGERRTRKLAGVDLSKMSKKEIFDLVDEDGSGFLSFMEFQTLLKYFGLTLTEQAAMEIFVQAEEDGNMFMEYDEFDNALTLIKKRLGSSSLDALGLSSPHIFKALAMATIIIIILLLFIFMGINAFTTGTAFGAIINSAMVAGGGILGGNKNDQDKNDEQIASELEDSLARVLE